MQKMYSQSSSNASMLLTSSLPPVAEHGDYEFYPIPTQQHPFFKDSDYSKMQRRDSGVDLNDPSFSQNIFHDFITEQEQSCDQQEENVDHHEPSIEPAGFFEALTMGSPTSNSEEYEQYPCFEYSQKYYKIEDASSGSFPLRYPYLDSYSEGSENNVEVCNPAAISPLPPFNDHLEFLTKNGFTYDYQFAMQPGALSPITPSTLAVETDSDCSLSSASNPSTPEPSSSPSLSSAPGLDGLDDLNDQPSKPQRSRGRRVSNRPDASGGKLFTCKAPNCGKVFKRSEHLKRHHRSIHTSDKPFPCPIPTCSKRFSRSDNLNQHIRIHRHGKESMKPTGRHFSNFTPFYAAK